jgi:hypothetical protein
MEDRLLHCYWEQVRGCVYVEVPIGGLGGAGNWPPGCTIRRIDAVRLPAAEGEPAILAFRANAKKFADELARIDVPEIIEIKSVLNRTAIGQALAGADMFERQYGKAGRPVIVCGAGDTALQWVCEERRSITVVRLDVRNSL